MTTINVYVRMRPFLPHESSESQLPARIFPDSSSCQVKVELTQSREKHFKFNGVFTDQQSQEEVYEGIDMRALVERVIDGYHSTVFAYGQTGSGKTFTIEGSEDSSHQGLIPRAITHLFKSLPEQSSRSYKILLSFIQIYNESIYDLIDLSQKPLKMRWNKHQQFTVENIFQGQCRSVDEALRWWKKGQKNKIMGSHKMNSASSRSHCILTLKVSSYDLQDPSDKIQSKLQIVDLAGSERQKVTKATGVVFREGIQINKSLFSLRQVISSLYQASTGSKNANQMLPPYRDSKLTSLLKQSIGGNSYCAMIACLNPTASHFEESLQTLTYASMASYISNIPTKNIDPKTQQNEQLREQNNQLKLQIKKMAEHIEYLTKLVEANQCGECKKRGKTQKRFDSMYETAMENKQRLERSRQIQDDEPAGIVSFPKINQIPSRPVIDIRKSSPEKLGKMEDKKITFRPLKSAKQIMQSISMIKDLISSNTSLRDKIESLKGYIEKQEKETFALMRENQVLRDRWDMVNGTVLTQTDTKEEAPIDTYERMVREQRGEARLQTKAETEGVGKMSYNDFLRGANRRKDKKDNIGRRKMRINSESKRINQNTFII